MTSPVAAIGPLEPDVVARPPGWTGLGTWNRAGVINAAELHAATRLAVLGGETDQDIVLAAALGLRAPRAGHVSVDLATAAETIRPDPEPGPAVSGLPWPDPHAWVNKVAASVLVTVGEEPGERPLRLVGTCLYLDRYWRDEIEVAADLRARALRQAPPAEPAALEVLLERLFPAADDTDQRAAVANTATRWLGVVAGGPGTGKTTTVARLLSALHAQSTGRPPLVALAAPTGRAASRLEEAVRAEALRLEETGAVGEPAAAWLAQARGSTLHRLLGGRRGSSRFRYHRGMRLPHDIVVVDEASMVSLSLMARLLEAVRPDARLILVGDPNQLVSVEAGAVLADITGPDGDPPPVMRGSVSLLRTNHRFAGPLAEVAAAVLAGDPDKAVEVLAGAGPAVRWETGGWTGADRSVVDWAVEMVEAGRRGDAGAALAALGRHRLLCAHREGPGGVARVTEDMEAALLERVPEVGGEGAWYAGRPVMMTLNDYGLRLFNGESGVAVTAPPSAGDGRLGVVFAGPGGQQRRISPARLGSVETVFATTVHKSQGSEFDAVTLLLPDAGSHLLTRELLYTAVTRARHRLAILGSEEALRAAVSNRMARASGLAARLT